MLPALCTCAVVLPLLLLSLSITSTNRFETMNPLRLQEVYLSPRLQAANQGASAAQQGHSHFRLRCVAQTFRHVLAL